MDKYIFNFNNGIVSVDTSTLKEETQEEYKNALGQELSLEDATPQGRLIDIDTTIKKNILDNNANLINSFNINLNYGSLLDAIAKTFNFERKPATQSRVKLILTGIPNTIIPANSKVSTENGIIFYSDEELTIGENGKIEGYFLSKEYGAIATPLNTIKNIIDGVYGWETVNNLEEVIIGNEIESDASFKRKIKNGALFNGKSLLQDYKSAIYKVDEVKSCYVRDNYEDFSVVYDGITIDAHSIYCCVFGGNDEEVAKAIFNIKSSGCSYSGNTLVTIKDEVFKGTYEIRFQRPTIVPVYVEVKVKNINSNSNDLESEIKQTIIDYSKGNLINFNQLGIGDNINCFDLASVISSVVSGITINQIKIGLDFESLDIQDININISQISNFINDNINVIIE